MQQIGVGRARARGETMRPITVAAVDDGSYRYAPGAKQKCPRVI